MVVTDRVAKYMAGAVLAGALALAGTSTAMAKELKIGTIAPGSHVYATVPENTVAAVGEMTDGKFSATVFPSGQLGNEAAMVQQIQTGALDIGVITVAELSNHVPELAALFAPYLVGDLKEAHALLTSDIGETLMQGLEAKGMVPLGYTLAGMRVMASRNDIEAVDDLKGAKMRITPFEPLKDFYSILEVAPTPMPLTAVYDAMANGQVDAVDTDIQGLWLLKFFEHANTVLLTKHSMFPAVFVVSARTWAEMSETEQTMFRDAASAEMTSAVELYMQQDADYLEQMRDKGVTFIDVPREALAEQIAAWDEIWIEKAPVLKDLRAQAGAM